MWSILITDGGVNRETMQYIVKACRTSGIPLFSDFSDIGCFDAALETGLLSSSDWSVLNETAVGALLRSLKKEEERREWEAELRSENATGESGRGLGELVVGGLKRCLVGETGTVGERRGGEA